jgi:hypothetical protein
MTPSHAIAMLDRQIAAHGQTIALKRGGAAEHSCKAFVRGYKPEAIAGLITLADRQVIVSPTGLGAFGVPADGDRFATNGRQGTVQPDVNPIYIDDVLVRVEMRVRLA